jgi:hypothetical protein
VHGRRRSNAQNATASPLRFLHPPAHTLWDKWLGLSILLDYLPQRPVNGLFANHLLKLHHASFPIMNVTLVGLRKQRPAMLFAMTVARFCAKTRIDKQAKAKTAKSLLMNVSFDGLSDNRRTADKLVRKLLGTAAIEFRRSGTITNSGTEVLQDEPMNSFFRTASLLYSV